MTINGREGFKLGTALYGASGNNRRCFGAAEDGFGGLGKSCGWEDMLKDAKDTLDRR